VPVLPLRYCTDAAAAALGTSWCKLLLLTARTKPQFATGPQKCVVLGPVDDNTVMQTG
jgi:hypothetical protein